LTQRWSTTDLRFAMLDRGFTSDPDLRARAAFLFPLDAMHGIDPIPTDGPQPCPVPATAGAGSEDRS
jgi:hypothetical protein